MDEKKWHAPKLYYLLDAWNVLNLPLGYLLSVELVSRSPGCDCVVCNCFGCSVYQQIDWHDLALILLPNIRFNSHKRKFFLIFIELLRQRRKKNQRKKRQIVRDGIQRKCDELSVAARNEQCSDGVDFSYQNNQYSIFISFSITLFMWCMWMRANRNKIVCIKCRNFGMDEWRPE